MRALIFLAFAFLGCGSSSPGSSTYTCCFNGAFYACPDATTLAKACDPKNPDPSGCMRDASKEPCK
jgi:hypothetical protein